MTLSNYRPLAIPTATGSKHLAPAVPASRRSGKTYLQGFDRRRPDEPRLSVLWRAKWAITACALACGLLAAAVASLPPTRYTAEATVRISLLSAKGVPRENVLAQNDLAAQYALLATSTPVTAAAELANEPAGTVQAAPVDGYNIVGITATASTAKTAAKRAGAVARALVTYVRTSEKAAAAAAAKVVAPQLKQLDTQIVNAQAAIVKLRVQIGHAKPASAGALQALLNTQLSLLGTLVSNKANVFTAATRDTAATTPQLTLLDTPAEGTPIPKHALVYGLVAFLVSALAAAEIAVLAFRLRMLARHGSAGR